MYSVRLRLQFISRTTHRFERRGGMSQIANMMVKKLKHSSPLLGKRVSAIGFTTACDAMEVSVVGESKPRTYNHVITTVPFSCLRAIDTTGCQLSWTLQTAIRTLHYDTATKVAMQFSRRWWEDTKPKHNQRGGVSSTDRPTRTVVYPSYGIGSDTGASIIVSYTWAQDAARLGALAQGKNSSAEKQLVDLILEDLAVMHGETKKALQDMLVDYHAFDWYNHENSAGTFPCCRMRCPSHHNATQVPTLFSVQASSRRSSQRSPGRTEDSSTSLERRPAFTTRMSSIHLSTY